ncbi:hypothetical protein LSTR_LSTR006568 [Laodelphax striatellus]|uniref:C2H2-type domain-containing protein n=1 Tax=Laodelphax striatellus TaxID=195883 RepID=A0A482WVF0_LAOST|nr:hypothetical protein LSTR_LSTR006568 [Laodelphax striatellus]
MKFPGADSDVLDPLLLSSWTASAASDHFLVEGGSHKLEDDDDEDSKPDMDELDLLLTSSSNNNSSSEPNNNRLAELKPLPPFTGYTGHLSINGISGHHFHTIAAAPSPPRLPSQVDQRSNSTGTGSTTSSNNGSDISDSVYYSTTTDHQVSSSTMPDVCLDGAIIKAEPDMSFGNPEIDDISKLIGLAIADTTVPSANDTSRDSWIDINSIESWFEGTIENTTPTSVASSNIPKVSSVNSSGGNGSTTTTQSVDSAILSETLQEFVNLQFTVPQVNAQTLYQQSLKQRDTSGYMPILQSRLTKPDTLAYMVAECTSPSSSTTAGGSYLAHSPPSHVVSTSDLQVRYNPVHSSTRPSPELQVSFPHTTTPNKKSKSRNKNKAQSAAATSTVVYAEGAMGKEKPIHRCTICNRGFLNKSNIKVHLRTHTGEKPFRCDVCGKAFRQKAHLIKHAQIHKRIGRD